MNEYENITTNPEQGEVERQKGIKNLKTWQKVACVAGLALVVAGAGSATAYLLLNQSGNIDTTPVSSATFTGQSETTITLKDGANKITSGGVYHITGSTENGWLTIDTSEEVKIILDNVTIKTSENQAIRSQQQNSVLIELVGENTLESSIPSSDDTKPAISIEGSLTIDGSGSATISSTGKGIKAVYNLVIQGGSIDITKSYEGLEASDITITGGEISITASDDGINASSTSKNEAEGTTTTTTTSGFGGMAGGIDVDDGSALTISGGKVYINAAGDGIDSNGNVTISGGEVYVDGPTNSGNGALDYNGSMTITGGTVIAVGMSGMAQNATESSQPAVLINLSSTYSDTFTFGDVTFTPSKSYNSIMISSASLQTGQTYNLTIGGTTVQSITISNNITNSGSSGMMMGGQGDAPNNASQGSQSNQGASGGTTPNQQGIAPERR
ncbi:carbohydrate-binding domain-containing protein [Candidatus Saccharibacteria bacterium]|nr:carbohydrate-binding domain-containing protein [Candidatus Saccharibacteria bacterium]